MLSPPLPSCLVPQAQYPPQHHILTRPQHTFLPQYERPSFTLTQNNMKNYIYALFIYLFVASKPKRRSS